MSKENEVIDQLKLLNASVDKILLFLSRKPNRVIEILTIAASAVAVAGIVGVVDQILKWVGH